MVPTLPRWWAIWGKIDRVDAIDRKILAELQVDGRLTVTELAERVRLSVSPCHRRLRALESSGAISGYRAQLDAPALGLNFEAVVFMTMRAADRDTVQVFEAAVQAVPNIIQAQRLFGDPDYLLRVVAIDLNDYTTLRDQKLATLPGVHRITSTIVMKRIVDNRPFPSLATRGGRAHAAATTSDRQRTNSRHRRG